MSTIQLLQLSSLRPHSEHGVLPPLSVEEYGALAADIAVRGVQVPLEATEDGLVLCGHHRLRAAGRAGLTEVPVIIRHGLSRSEQIQHMVSDNLQRRHLTPSQRAAAITYPPVEKTILETLEPQARKRQEEGRRLGGQTAGRGRRRADSSPAGLQASNRKRHEWEVAAMLGRLAGVSVRLIYDARRAWAKAPENMEAIRAGRSREGITALASATRQRRNGGPSSAILLVTLCEAEGLDGTLCVKCRKPVAPGTKVGMVSCVEEVLNGSYLCLGCVVDGEYWIATWLQGEAYLAQERARQYQELAQGRIVLPPGEEIRRARLEAPKPSAPGASLQFQQFAETNSNPVTNA